MSSFEEMIKSVQKDTAVKEDKKPASKPLNESTDGETKTYTITANSETLKRLEKLLVACRWMGNGSSRSILFSFDGDGSDRLSCKELEDIKLSEKEADKLSNGSGILINRDGQVSKMTRLPEWEVGEETYKVKESTNLDEELETIPVPVTHNDHKCPHCGEMIHEKGIYSDDNGKTIRHGKCKGRITFYKTAEEKEAEDLAIAKLRDALGICPQCKGAMIYNRKLNKMVCLNCNPG